MSLPEETYTLLYKYLNDELKDTEKALFEEELEKNDELKLEVSLHKELDEFMLEGESISSLVESQNRKEYEEFVDNQSNQEFYKKLKTYSGKTEVNTNVKKVYNKKIRNINYKWLISAAATILILAIFAPTIFQSQGGKLYSKNSNYDSLPSLTSKSANDNQFYSNIEKEFINGNYKKVVKQYELTKIGPSDQKYITMLYYNIALTETGEIDQAINNMNKLYSNKNYPYRDWAQYYEALFYLKKGKKEIAKELLEVIAKSENHKKKQRAETVLEELE